MGTNLPDIIDLSNRMEQVGLQEPLENENADFLSNQMGIASKCKDKNFLQEYETPQPKRQGRFQEPRENFKAQSLSNLMSSLLSEYKEMNLQKEDKNPKFKCKGIFHESRENAKTESLPNLLSKQKDKNLQEEDEKRQSKCQSRFQEPRENAKAESLSNHLSKNKDKNFQQEDEKRDSKCQGRFQEPHENAKEESKNLDQMSRQNPGSASKSQVTVRKTRANAKAESKNLDQMPRQNSGISSKRQGRTSEPRENTKAGYSNIEKIPRQTPGNSSKCQDRVREPRTSDMEEERLRKCIALVEAQSFELRDSNVKLKRLSKAQDAKLRELRHKITLQEQKRQKEEAEKKTLRKLEEAVEQKLMLIKNLKAEIELIRTELTADDDCQRRQNIVTPARISRLAVSHKPPSTRSKRRSDNCGLESIHEKVSAIPSGSIEGECSKKSVKKVPIIGSMAKSCRGRKTESNIPSTAAKFSGGNAKRYSDLGSVLMKLKDMLEELNSFSIVDLVSCKGFLEDAQSRIEGLLAQANG